MLAAANQDLKDQFHELEALQQKTREMAETDMLTGLKNHGHFQDQLKEEVVHAQQQGKPLSLIMFDLDRFKSVNDDFGHQRGDQVLKAIGRLVREEMRIGRDYAARYGGEEFVIIMAGVDSAAAIEAADKLRAQIRRLAKDLEMPQRYVAASFGVADLPTCASDAGSLISAADAALLFAKRKGRDRVAYFRDLSRTELKEGDLDKLHSRLEGASLQTIRALAEAVDACDQYSAIDAATMSRVAQEMAVRLGMNQEQADALSMAARLHDIGKIGIPGSVLRKTEKLSAEELVLVRQHPEMGQRILEEAKQIQELVAAILYHHERWDGAGYPEHLQGEQIPLMARIVGIMDAYRAMLSDRPYRKALTIDEAVSELRKGAGSQFDPRLVDLFVDLVRQGEVPPELKQVG